MKSGVNLDLCREERRARPLKKQIEGQCIRRAQPGRQILCQEFGAGTRGKGKAERT